MKVSELGEFRLIDLLEKKVYRTRDERESSWRQLVIGIGDDAAAWHCDNSTQLATVDSLVQDVHFNLGIVPWKDLGWKATVANLSDIAAMGGRPRYALVALALPDDTEVDDVAAFYEGMIKIARQFGVAIVGGNISRASLVIITITVFGSAVDSDRILTRSAAMPGEQVAVTGYIGGAAAGLEVLTRNLQLDLEIAAHLKGGFLRPSPRIIEGQLLVEQGVRVAIDISDGLIGDLNHICEASRVSARIEVDRVPVKPEIRAAFGNRAMEMALSGGEDYELLFTASNEVVHRVKQAASCPITVIGEIIANEENKVILVDGQGSPFHLDRSGWDHFKPVKVK